MQSSVLKAVALDIVMFPVWWYSHGLALMLGWCGNLVKGYAKFFAIDVWMKNLFVPMFGQYDWQSRLISIFMRSVQIAGRSFALMVIAGAGAGLLALYLAGPMVLILFAAYNIIGSLLYVS